MGTVSTEEKFEKHRLSMAKGVWSTMLETDSRECRNCHNFRAMDYYDQEKRAAERHQVAEREGMTCIQCHQGVAHDLPDGADDAFEKLEKKYDMAKTAAEE